jgi:hypothetical protein
VVLTLDPAIPLQAVARTAKKLPTLRLSGFARQQQGLIIPSTCSPSSQESHSCPVHCNSFWLLARIRYAPFVPSQLAPITVSRAFTSKLRALVARVLAL